MRQHFRRSRPGRPCGAPARRSRGRRLAGRPGQGVSSAPRIGGEVPYSFQRTSGAGGRSRRSERPSARTRRGVGEPALRPASIGFDKTRGRAGGPRHVPDCQASASGPARAVPENSIVLRSRFPRRPRRHPGAVRATLPSPLRPGSVPRRRASRAIESSRAGGYASSRTARTIDRGPMSSARARSRSAALVSSRSTSVAPSPGGTLDDTSSFSPGVAANHRQHFRGEVPPLLRRHGPAPGDALSLGGGRSTSARSRRPTLPLRIGMKLGAVRTAAGRALFRLQVPGADLPGRWVCLTQRFVLVKKSGAGGRAVR